MGKHERKSIEEAEIIVVKLLNNENLSISDLKNHWLKHAEDIVQQIKKDFSSITSARHLGNNFTTIGDISFVSNGRDVFIEVKMSDTKSGLGTKANISQDALTENKLFESGVDSWSEFRNKKSMIYW